MELRQLRYFVAVIRHRGFTAAATAIGVAQPALSQQIKLLEQELGVALIDRGGRRVRLTPAGEQFLVRADRVLAEVASARDEMTGFAGALRGRVIVGTLPSLAEAQLPTLVTGFHHRYPGLDLILREAATGALLEMLTIGDVDLALLHQPVLPDSVQGVTLEPLFTEELVAVVARGHHLATRKVMPLAALREEPFILTKSGSVIRDTILAACAAAGFAPHIAFESSGAATVRAFAAAGLGVAIVPRSEAAVQSGVVRLALRPTLTRTVALAWATNRYHSPAANAFLAVAREVLRRS